MSVDLFGILADLHCCQLAFSRLHLTNEEQTCQHEFALSGRGIRSQRTVAVWSRWVCSRPKSEFRTCTRRLSSWRHTASRSPFATVHRPGQIKILSMLSQIGAEREVRVRGKKKTGTKKSVPACELAGRPDKTHAKQPASPAGQPRAA